MIFNASYEELMISLPEGKWNLNINEVVAGTDTICQREEHIHVAPISVAVLTRC